MTADEHDEAAADAHDGAGRRVRRSTGRRAQLQQERTRARRQRLLRASLILALVVTAGVVVGPSLGRTVASGVQTLFDRSDDPSDTEPTGSASEPGPAAEAGRTTILVATFPDAADAAAAAGLQGGTTSVQLMTVDRETGRGAIVFVPVDLVSDVPGYGLLPVAEAGGFGGAPLVELTIENALGVAVDATVTMSEQSWAALFARVGGFEVDVRETLSQPALDGGTIRRFEAGPQFLDGQRLAELLTFRQRGEAELSTFPRVQQVLEGFLDAVGADGLDAVFEDGAPMLDTTGRATVEDVLRALATSGEADLLDARTLPVTAVGAGTDAYYRLDGPRTTEFVLDVLGGPVGSGDGAPAGMRLEVLNGNGKVGVGADVASLLVPLGHTVVITRNADAFDHAETVVRLHGDSDALLAAGRAIIEALGVGRLEISAVTSTTVDVTIVVGADFRP